MTTTEGDTGCEDDSDEGNESPVYNMDKQFISEPMDFQYKEGKSVDFEKTFDLTGNDNDEMLRVYLKKAGLSENIECLSAEQRKALIYDIVKSNKNPGYWKPSVVPFMTPKTTNQTQLSSSITLPSIDDIPPASMTFDYAQFAQLNGSDSKDNGKYVSDVSNREQQQAVRGTLFERQFQQPKIYNTPPTPPSPSTLVKRKGLTIEISGPVNFQHVSGDMTRDMTKNAFDLSGQFNDNSLKKYMIERGITEEDVAGIETKELIRRIVQSRFTWMPALRYTGNHIPPPPSETFRPPSPSPPSRHKPTSKGGALIVAPPKPPEEGSPSENIYLEIIPTGSSPVTRRPVKSPPPPPPSAGVKHTFSSGKHNPPPPPPQALNTTSSVQVEKMATERTIPPPPPPMAVISNSGGGPPPPPPPVSSVNTRVGGPPPPPPPPMPSLNTSAGGPPPPPPPPMASHNTSTGGPFPPPLPKSETTKKPIASGVDNRDAFLESIRAGVTLKKLNKPNEAKSNTGSIKISSNNLSQQPNPPDSIKQKPTKVEPLDLMSELRNATLKRIKKLENNPYAGEGQESNC